MKEYELFDIELNDRDSAHRDRFATQWVEESVLLPENAASRSYIGTNFTKKTFAIFLAIFLGAFAILLGRMVELQVMRGKHFRAMAEGNRERIVPIPAERGLIYDRTGRPLTINVPNFSLALTPQHLPRNSEKRRELVERLGTITKQPTEDIWRSIEEYGAYSYASIILQENLDYETALTIQILAAELPGIYIVRGSKRLYLHDIPKEALAFSGTSSISISHTLGYEGKLSREELDRLYADGYLPSDFIGKTGVEKTYESYLRGVYGRKRVEVNALGREQSVLAEAAPTPGYHVTLSIDTAMQATLESLLERALEANQKKRAAGIVLDPRSGEVLALVSLPAFDNNAFSGGISIAQYARYRDDPDQPLFHRAIGGTYPSGSTVKPALAAAALQERIITPQSVFLSNGGLRVGEWFFPDWLAGGHGWTNVISSLANSVNTFYYYIGGGYDQFRGLGIERIMRYLQLFGFGAELGIDIVGEMPGFLPEPSWKEATKGEPWYIGDTYNISIGQGDLLVTPLQIAAMTAAIGNGGTLYRPHVVREITHPLTNERVPIYPTAIRSDIIDPEHLATVRAGMRACVTDGSCRRLADLPLPAAGKTGTAQWRSDKEHHGWFTSFAPYDSPEIVVTILVEEGGEGSAIAAPIAKDFYAWWSAYRQNSPVDSER